EGNTINGKDIAQEPIGLNCVIGQNTVGIKALVPPDQWHIKLSAGQMESIWIGIVFVARIQGIKGKERACQALVDVLSGVVFSMVVIPQEVHDLQRILAGREHGIVRVLEVRSTRRGTSCWKIFHPRNTVAVGVAVEIMQMCGCALISKI